MPKTVLIADDDAVTVATLSAAVRDLGLNVIVARDTLQTVMAAQRSSPDVILLDIQMPGGTGLEALKRLNNSSRTQGIPVIVVTSSEDKALPDRVRELGARDFMRKPVAHADLKRLLLTILKPEPAGE